MSISKNEICRIFKKELDKISQYNGDIVLIMIDMLQELTDDKFWTETASATGVHHPATSNTIGGNIIHTKQAFWIANSIMNIDKTLQWQDKLIVLCAILLHDINKFNQPLSSHGTYAANKIIEYATQHGIYNKQMYCIMLGVRCHMGEWGIEQLDKLLITDALAKKVVEIVHMADYLSSRPFLLFDESEAI